MKKKGFTLIELLAVIVILAIIAIIATPMIMGVIERARKGAALGSANSYLHSVEMYLTLQDINEYSEKLESNKVYSIYETTELYEGTEEIDSTILLSDYIDVKGDYPIDGYVEIGANKIEEAIFNINGYRIECDNQLICKVTNKISTEIVEAESVTIKEIDTSSLSVGDQIQLEATILPIDTTRKKVTWSSSDENVATITAKGLLTIVGNGKTTITAKTTNNKLYTVEIEIFPQPSYIFDGEKINYATMKEVPDASNQIWNRVTIENGAITMQITTGWGASSISFTDFTIDIAEYKKLIVEAAWQEGYDYWIKVYYKDGTETVICGSGYTGPPALYPIGKVSFDRTRFEVDLTDKDLVESIVFCNSSQSAKMTIYDIHFES